MSGDDARTHVYFAQMPPKTPADKNLRLHLSLVPATLLLTILICNPRAIADATTPQPNTSPPTYTFGTDTPENQSVDVKKLISLTQFIKSGNDPILSLLISRNDKVVYALYTSDIDPQAAHYIMSATKSFLSALTGVAIDRKLLPGINAPINTILPRSWFPSDAAFTAFGAVTLKDALAMSALDAPVFPHQTTPDAIKRDQDYFHSPNRTIFALTQKILPNPGHDYLYTDVTCAIPAGAIECAAKETLLEFANRTLFKPMDFQNQEWMHQDDTGIDNGAYGLRLRPIDMQKFGVLFMNFGNWQGTQLISPDWVRQSFHPWIASEAQFAHHPNYGSYWWKIYYTHGWEGEVAVGWKGQYIAIFPKQKVVITMTSIYADNNENEHFTTLIRNFIAPAIIPRDQYVTPDPTTAATQDQQLAALLDEVHSAPRRIRPGTEPRMIPSTDWKDPYVPFEGP